MNWRRTRNCSCSPTRQKKRGGSGQNAGKSATTWRRQAAFFKVTLIAREENYGLARNVIEGVTEIIERYGTVIVLEDDLVTNRYFLRFMNDALSREKNPKR